MNESLNHIRETIILIKYYSFDLGKYNIRELIVKWTKSYPHDWILMGVIEAIYQGRLKAISVEQILNIWQKKGYPNQSFNYEFSRLIKPNMSFTLQQDQELEDILIDRHLSNNQDNLEMTNNQNNHNLREKEGSLNEFEPIEDYSQCFQKLKNFIE